MYPLPWGPLPGGPGGPWTPKNKIGGSSNRFDPPRFKKNIKILFKNKRINNNFENRSQVVTISKHFPKFIKIFSYQNHFIFSFTQNF